MAYVMQLSVDQFKAVSFSLNKVYSHGILQHLKSAAQQAKRRMWAKLSNINTQNYKREFWKQQDER